MTSNTHPYSGIKESAIGIVLSRSVQIYSKSLGPPVLGFAARRLYPLSLLSYGQSPDSKRVNGCGPSPSFSVLR